MTVGTRQSWQGQLKGPSTVASKKHWEMLGSLLLFLKARCRTDMCGPDGAEEHSRACKPAGISSVLGESWVRMVYLASSYSSAQEGSRMLCPCPWVWRAVVPALYLGDDPTILLRADRQEIT